MIYCQPCSKDGESVPAESYCIVCEEFMCSTCTRLHRMQQMSSSHSLLVKESIPLSIKVHSIKNDCTEPCEIHPQEVIKYFCLTHKTLNCGHCLAVEHRSCEVEIISEVSNTFKDSSEYGHIKSSIVELLKNSDTCSSNIVQSIEFVTKLGEDEITKLRTFRDEINKYFERSENDLLETIQNMKNMNETLLHCLQPKCESLKIEIQEIKSKLEANENNTFQLFLEAKRAQKTINGLQSALADIMKKNTVQQYQFIKDPATERLLTSHIGLGVIQKNAARDIQTCITPPKRSEYNEEDKLTGIKPKFQQSVVLPKVESHGALERPATFSTSLVDENDDDVEITKVEEATPEEIEGARKLMLPDHFYVYTRLPDCPGCLGCDDGAGQYCHQAEDESGKVGNNYEDGDDDGDDDDDDDDDNSYEDEYDDEEESYEDTEQPENNSGEGVFRSDGGSLFGGGSAGGFSFASLAKASPHTTFSGEPEKPFHWQGAGKQLFWRAARGYDSDDEGEDQQGEDPQFESVVPLLDLVEVKTGEEDEVAVFSQRSKLFRFDKNANQWKEKGIGEMKILKHKSTGKYRLLLRREQVYKLACNHALTADMNFEPLKTSETSWIWHAQDYAESQPRLEQFALKFKNIDLARSFKNKIDEIQQELRS